MSLTAIKLQKHRCNVVCLDGTVIHCDVTNLTRGNLLFDYACAKIGIREKHFFGLKYKHHVDGKDSWLQSGTFLGKKMQQNIYSLQLRVKHWPAFPAYVKDTITRYHMVLDLKTKFINGEMTCSAPMKALLASYFIQGEVGDHCPAVYDDSNFKQLKFFQDQPSNFMDIVSQFHIRHKGLSPSDCDMIFLDHVRRLKYYGVEYFDIMDNDGVPLLIGFGYAGIRIYRDGSIMNEFPWVLIEKIDRDLKKKILYIHIKVPTEKASDLIICGFNALVKRDLKRMYRVCVDHKQFFSSSDNETLCSANDLPREDFLRAQIIKPRTSTRSESSNSSSLILHLEEEEPVKFNEDSPVESEPTDRSSSKLKDLAARSSTAADDLSETFSEVDIDINNSESVFEDSYTPMKIKYPSSNLAEPILMEEKSFNLSADLTMERLSSTRLDQSTNEELHLDCAEKSEESVNKLFELDISQSVENDTNKNDGINLGGKPDAKSDENRKKLQILSEDLLEEEFINAQHESNENFFQQLENENSFSSNSDKSHLKISHDDSRIRLTSTSSSNVVDNDIDTDTVIVETEQVTSQEVDPNTSNIVVVTQVVVTEIEASMEVSLKADENIAVDRSFSSHSPLTVSKKTSIVV